MTNLVEVLSDKEKETYHRNFMKQQQSLRDRGVDIVDWNIKPDDVWAIGRFDEWPHKEIGKPDYIYSARKQGLPAVYVEVGTVEYIWFEHGCYYPIISQDEHETEKEFFARCSKEGAWGLY